MGRPKVTGPAHSHTGPLFVVDLDSVHAHTVHPHLVNLQRLVTAIPSPVGLLAAALARTLILKLQRGNELTP